MTLTLLVSIVYVSAVSYLKPFVSRKMQRMEMLSGACTIATVFLIEFIENSSSETEKMVYYIGILILCFGFLTVYVIKILELYY